jgi:hypothetical protein
MLKCISKYSSSAGSFAPGDIIEDPKLEAVLLADSAASFAEVESREQAAEVEVVEAAPKIRGLRRKA